MHTATRRAHWKPADSRGACLPFFSAVVAAYLTCSTVISGNSGGAGRARRRVPHGEMPRRDMEAATVEYTDIDAKTCVFHVKRNPPLNWQPKRLVERDIVLPAEFVKYLLARR